MKRYVPRFFRLLFALAAMAGSSGLCAAQLEKAKDLVEFAYSVNRIDAEKTPGSLTDGDVRTGIRWHTKFKANTDIICELKESRDIDRVEIHIPKYTKWYIVDEVRVAVDDGFGGFGEPVVLPGIERSPANGPLRDKSCTNHVIAATGLGKAVRVKVTVVSNAAAGVNEIRLCGSAPKAVPESRKSAAPRPSCSEVLSKCRKLENRHWKLAFNPLGGRIMSLYSKAIGTELTTPDAHGSFTEEVWDRRRSRKFLLNQPFEMNYDKGADGSIKVTAVGNAQGGAIDFLKVVKRYGFSDDSTALRLDYRFENIPDAMALQNYALLLHATLGVYGREVTCFYPTTEGIVAVPPGKRGNEYWGHRPSRGWMAAATDDGTGVAITMPFKELKAFYSWFSQVPTLEWRMIPIGLDAGAGYDVSSEIIPFKGLKKVSGAGGGLVGCLDAGLCTVVSSRAGEVTAVADGREFALKFSRCGETVSFRTQAKSVAIKRDGKVVCQLDCAPSQGAWVLAKEGQQRESSVAEVDLACYTNFPRTVSQGWAKPLPGKRLKVSVITGNGNLLEVGRLAERFDFEYRTIGVGVSGKGEKRTFSNPIFSDGDNFSLVNTADIERGVKKVLEYDSDVILVGGVPFSVFAKDLREILIKRVKNGTALVWIGLDSSVPELSFKLEKARLSKSAPAAKTSAFASVPFSVFGGEDVYRIALPEDATVHAECPDRRPYLAETKLGKGKVFHIAYRALTYPPWQSPGLTPAGLQDFYEDKTAPVEQYYSLIAKTLMAAAGRELPVRFESVDIKPKRAVFEVTSLAGGNTSWDWRLVDSFGNRLASGSSAVKLAQGKQKVVLDGLQLPAKQGPLLFELALRTRNGGVLNWGSWTFENAPEAEIASLKADRSWLNEGDEVAFTVKLAGNTVSKRIVVELTDSYGRTLSRMSPPAGAEVKGKFVIENRLPARSCTINAYLHSHDGAVLSQRRTLLYVRPKAERYVWDDYEVGIWASSNNREYLWGGLAEIYRRIGISTVIANPPRMQKEFPMRYNINPTLLSGAGLHRCAEPDAYAKSGDKMKLVRPTCLSSPAFFAGRAKTLDNLAKEIARYGLRFVWFGDELSITGYGGTPVDFCFSEHCLGELRSFAKARYGTLEKLNETWESDFASWDEVVPFTRQEVWAAGGRHVAGWSDHLEFMDSRLTNSIAFSVNRLKKADPCLRFAISGTQRPSAYGGMDWWKQLKVLDATLNYGEGGQFDIHRSFCPDGGLMPWNWGYSKRGAGAVEEVWRTAFFGMRGIMGFQSTSQINQDWTFSKGLKDTFPHIRRLVEGTGKHFVNNLVTKKEVAILYSQASLRASFIEKRREEHDKLGEKVRLLLRNLGYAYDYVSYEELAAGELLARGYRALILCDACAMSDAEIAGVKAFADGGGSIISEGMPAVREANCRKRAKSPLSELFSPGEKHVLFGEIDTRYLKAIKYPCQKENAPVVKMERDRYGAALERAGASVTRLAVVDEETSQEAVNLQVFPKADRAGNLMWGVVASNIENPRDARFGFPKKAWTYDLVSGRSYGEVKELRLPLGKGVPYAFVQLPQEFRLSKPKVDGCKIEISANFAVDAVVRLRLFRPDGSEAEEYACNILLKQGRAAHEIPFALSDPEGKWKLKLASVFGPNTVEAELHRHP